MASIARWPPHPYIQYNSVCICLGVMNLVSLPRFLGVKESTEIIFRVKKVTGKGE